MCYNELHTAVYILHFNSWKQRKQWGRDAAFEKKKVSEVSVCARTERLQMECTQLKPQNDMRKNG